MKRIFVLVLGLTVVAAYASTLVITGAVASEKAEELCIPMGTITLAPPDTVEPKRSDVEFPHPAHFSINCQQCHHQWDFESPIESCATSGCHDLEKAPTKEDGDEPILYYKAAYHTLCIGCHKEIKAKNDQIAKVYPSASDRLAPTGPTGCVQCHPKD